MSSTDPAAVDGAAVDGAAPAPRGFAGAIGIVRSGLLGWRDFDGRASRPEFWGFVVFAWAAQLLASKLDALIFGTAHMGGPKAVLIALVLAVPIVAAAARRLRDAGRSPRWLLLTLIAVPELVGLVPMTGLVGLIPAPFMVLLVYFLVQPSQATPRPQDRLAPATP